MDSSHVHWTTEEDQLLEALVYNLGTANWQQISVHLPTHSTKDCKSHWRHFLSRKSATLGWTIEEDALLRTLYSRFGNQWSIIAGLMKHRDKLSVQGRWRWLMDHNMGKLEHTVVHINRTQSLWTKDEDALLLSAVQKIGPRNWDLIAAHVPNRTGPQCRRRFTMRLQEKPKEWSADEDKQLIQLANEFKCAWKKIATQMPGRTWIQLKKRHQLLIDENSNSSSPSERSVNSILKVLPPIESIAQFDPDCLSLSQNLESSCYSLDNFLRLVAPQVR